MIPPRVFSKLDGILASAAGMGWQGIPSSQQKDFACLGLGSALNIPGRLIFLFPTLCFDLSSSFASGEFLPRFPPFFPSSAHCYLWPLVPVFLLFLFPEMWISCSAGVRLGRNGIFLFEQGLPGSTGEVPALTFLMGKSLGLENKWEPWKRNGIGGRKPGAFCYHEIKEC